MLFPILLILTICILFFFIVIYQKASLHHSATLIAERVAYVWNNSEKDPVTGEFERYTTDVDSADGLYWRLFGDNFLSKFGLTLSDNSLVSQKLDKHMEWNDYGGKAEVKYDNKMTGGDIVVTMEEPLKFPSFFTNLFGTDRIQTEVKASINDPVEFIRTIDLVVYYGERMMNSKRSPLDAINIFKKK